MYNKIKGLADDRYNGWQNRETWLIRLHIDNDELLYLYFWASFAKRLTRNRNKREIAAWIRNWCKRSLSSRPYFIEDAIDTSILYLASGSLSSRAESLQDSLIRGVWRRVNWYEVVTSYLDESADMDVVKLEADKAEQRKRYNAQPKQLTSLSGLLQPSLIVGLDVQ